MRRWMMNRAVNRPEADSFRQGSSNGWSWKQAFPLNCLPYCFDDVWSKISSCYTTLRVIHALKGVKIYDSVSIQMLLYAFTSLTTPKNQNVSQHSDEGLAMSTAIGFVAYTRDGE